MASNSPQTLILTIWQWLWKFKISIETALRWNLTNNYYNEVQQHENSWYDEKNLARQNGLYQMLKIFPFWLKIFEAFEVM